MRINRITTSFATLTSTTKSLTTSMSTAATNNNNTNKNNTPYDVAIIGGGIAGCAAARSLTLHDQHHDRRPVRTTIYEIGRGPGGRASNRRTRALPNLRIDHGAPFGNFVSKDGKELAEVLGLEEFGGRCVVLDPHTGVLLDENEEEDTMVRYNTSDLASRLLSVATDHVMTRYSTMVRSLSYHHNNIDCGDSTHNKRWSLCDGNGSILGTADYLIVSGSGIAHPRWTGTFGDEPPLLRAAVSVASSEKDSVLEQALVTIADQTSDPILAVFFYCTGDKAQEWLSLGYQTVQFGMGGYDGDGILAKLHIQPQVGIPGGVAVVLHSTIQYAKSNTGVYGSTSSAARVGDASSDSSREEVLIREMLGALGEMRGLPNVVQEESDIVGGGGYGWCGYGPFLHRWGNAFPNGEPLSQELALCEGMAVGFGGDYVEIGNGVKMGSVEAALLSGTVIGERIARLANSVSS